MKPLRILPLLLVALATAPALPAADAAAESARLRDTVRALTLQARDAQTQLAALQAEKQAAKDEADKKIAALTKGNEEQAKRLVADKAAADKSIAELKAAAATQADEITRLKGELDKMTAAYRLADGQARATETERAKLAAANLDLTRLVADRETKNRALFSLGNEILLRYEKFSLGEALAAKEPFVGTTRVRLENLVQGYADQLLKEKVKP